MKEYAAEIGLIIGGIITTAGGWFFGGKQASKGKTNETLTRGADQIVDTSNKLLEKLDQIATEERERTDIERARTETERAHKVSCEESLREHKKMINDLKKKVGKLEKIIK